MLFFWQVPEWLISHWAFLILSGKYFQSMAIKNWWETEVCQFLCFIIEIQSSFSFLASETQLKEVVSLGQRCIIQVFQAFYMLLSAICSIMSPFCSLLQVYEEVMRDIWVLLLSFIEVWRKNYFVFFWSFSRWCYIFLLPSPTLCGWVCVLVSLYSGEGRGETGMKLLANCAFLVIESCNHSCGLEDGK